MNEILGELITVSRRDPKFQDYLSGNFSKTERALSIQSLNVSTESEQVTFQLVPLDQIQKPNFFARWAQILKLHNFYLVAFPVLVMLMKNWMDETLFDWPTAIESTLACLFLMAAVNLRNDFLDYSSGLDRVHPHSGSRAIQQGWITAAQIKKLSNFFLVFGFLLGLPALYFNHQELYLVAALAVLAAIGFTSYKMGLKYRRWSEVTVFLLLGPLLTSGIQLSTGASLDWETVMIGVVTGWYAVFYLHLKNFEQLMVNHQAAFKNTMTWLGFESGKRLLFVWWLVFLILFGAYHFYFSAVVWNSMMLTAALISGIIFSYHLKNLRSPVGSGMTATIDVARKMGVAMLSLWGLELIWSLWTLR